MGPVIASEYEESTRNMSVSGKKINYTFGSEIKYNELIAVNPQAGERPKHLFEIVYKNCICWGAWVAQLVKQPTLDFGSGHDLTVREIEPLIGSLLGILCLLLSLSLPHSCSPHDCLSLKINKHFLKIAISGRLGGAVS